MSTRRYRYVELGVGLFMLFGLLSLVFMVLKVSGLVNWGTSDTYKVTANFTNIGGLKPHAPVTVAGVKIGEVSRIDLQPDQLNAKVTMSLRQDKLIPFEDASARILTEGLLGSNYISIVPGFEADNHDHPYLRAGDEIAKTQEAIILENLVGQLMFNIQK